MIILLDGFQGQWFNEFSSSFIKALDAVVAHMPFLAPQMINSVEKRIVLL